MNSPLERYLVRPGISSSSGHDKFCALAGACLNEAGIGYQDAQLAPNTATDLSALAWRGVDLGKGSLALLHLLPELSRRGPFALLKTRLESSSTSARKQNGLSDFLLRNYRKLLPQIDCLISSHYMALPGPSRLGRALLLGPDIYPHQTLKPWAGSSLQVLSGSENYRQELLAMGFDAQQLLPAGILLPGRVVEAARLRRAGFAKRPKAFFAVGGSAPEARELYRAVETWLGTGNSAVVLCGDGRLHNQVLRRALEALRSPQLEVLGGRAQTHRRDELRIYLDQLTMPELSHWFTRPNEGCVLALALGFRLRLLSAYQPHEMQAANYLLEHYQRAVTRFNDSLVGLGLESQGLTDGVRLLGPRALLQDSSLSKLLEVPQETISASVA